MWHKGKYNLQLLSQQSDFYIVIYDVTSSATKVYKMNCMFIPFLEHNNTICLEVTEVQLASFLNDIWVLTYQQPADVRKEEASFGIMWVCISLWIFVVDTVVSTPLKDIILNRKN